MSQRPINRSPDLKRLRDEGYSIEIEGGFLVVRNVPYLNSRKEVLRGVFMCKLDLADDIACRPEDHTIFFSGEYPCNPDGSPIEKIRHSSETKELVKGLAVNHRFSAKPKPSDAYDDFYAKMTTYVAILQGPAQSITAGVKANEFLPVSEDPSDESTVFNYVDTASSRAEINLITDKLKAVSHIAIVGLGGTGAYILDLVAKTPVHEIHLFDGDVFLQHNAFRSPGAPSLDSLRSKDSKVSYYARIYSQMRRGIVPHATYLEADNLNLLEGMSFVFLCIDRGSEKRAIVERIEALGIPFIDVGMGVYEGEGSLGGAVRVTTSTPTNRDQARSRIPFSDGDGQNEYARNIQIADLNMLNASLAVMRWKKSCGFYQDAQGETHSTYTVELHLLTREDTGK